jgi:hypothetical protein
MNIVEDGTSLLSFVKLAGYISEEQIWLCAG